MSTSTKARHRKDARPVTSVSPVARRSIAAAASSGVALAMIASGAHAAPSTDEAASSSGTLESTGVNTLTAGARAAITTNSAVLVSPDAAAPADAEAEASAEAPVVEQPAVAQTDTAAAAQPETTTEAAPASSSSSSDSNADVQASAPSASTSSTAAPASNASGAVAIAMQYVGSPYVMGASGPDAFDCSGLVQYVYSQLGISLPRTSYAQGSAGTLVSAAEAQPGDIVYFGGHVGIYAGDGKMIDAGNESTGVVYRDIYQTPIGFVRVS